MNVRQIFAASALALAAAAAQASVSVSQVTVFNTTVTTDNAGVAQRSFSVSGGNFSFDAVIGDGTGTITSFTLSDSLGVIAPDIDDDSASPYVYGITFYDLLAGNYTLTVNAGANTAVSLMATADVELVTNGGSSTAVPEPEALALALAGVSVVGLLARRRKAA